MGMFDLTPDQVPMLQAQDTANLAGQMANLPAGRAGVYAASQAGSMLGNAAAGALGYQDPRLTIANKLQSAMNDTNNSGIDFAKDPVSYFNTASKNLAKYGLYDQAFAAADKAKDAAAAQASQATASATNLATYQTAAAQKRMGDLAAQFTQDGKLDQKGYVGALMSDSNPKVREAGINLAKEYQSLAQGKYQIIPNGANALNVETQQLIGNDANQWQSLPGESADETNRRILTNAADIVRNGGSIPEKYAPLVRQAFVDYHNRKVDGVGVVQAPVNDELNPSLNFGITRSPDGKGTVLRNDLVATPAAVAASQNAPSGGAGRTGPSVTTLPGGGGATQPGYIQPGTPAGEKELDSQTNKFGEYIVKSQIPQLDRSFANVDAILKQTPVGKAEGIGGWWNSPLAGYVMGIGQKLGDPALQKQMEAAKDNRTSVIAVTNYITRIMAGLNQTAGETARITMENATGMDSTETDFRNAFQKVFSMYKDLRQSAIGSFPPEVRQRYQKYSGMDYTDPTRMPGPTQNNLPQNQQSPALVKPQPSQDIQAVPLPAKIEYLPNGQVDETLSDGRVYHWKDRTSFDNFHKSGQ